MYKCGRDAVLIVVVVIHGAIGHGSALSLHPRVTLVSGSCGPVQWSDDGKKVRQPKMLDVDKILAPEGRDCTYMLITSPI